MVQAWLWLGLMAWIGGSLHAEENSSGGGVSRVAKAKFAFALIGDLPYGDEQVEGFDRLIDNINRDHAVKFVLHVGDIKGGGEPCDDDRILSRFAQYQKFNQAFIYTPGDNEWTDCHRASNGRYYPLERLAFLRRTFFSDPDRSTGRRPIRVISQARSPGFGEFVENVRFVRGNIVFGTLHVVGSNNDLRPWTGFDPDDSVANPRADRWNQFERRRDAALAWLEAIFGQAEQIGAGGIFIAMQANPHFELAEEDPGRAGFNAIIRRLYELTATFKKPVVLAHGDFHQYLLDKPFANFQAAPHLSNFTRIQTFGSPQMGWVKVHIVPRSSNLFIFEQRIVASEAP